MTRSDSQPGIARRNSATLLALAGSWWILGCAPAPPAATVRVTPERLEQSLALARDYLLAQQTERGDFHYQWHCLKGEWRDEPQPVRRAGAFWGLALVHQHQPSAPTRAALLRTVAFYRKQTREVIPGVRFLACPEARHGETGTVALVTLALIELLQAEPRHAEATAWREQIQGHVEFLLRTRQANGHFAAKYQLETGVPYGDPSPYYDGEALLALAVAARCLPRDDLIATVVESAHRLHEVYGVQAREQESDSPLTKAFYPWGSLAFFELDASGWPQTETFAKSTIELAHWILDVHQISRRQRNTAYAYEGLACAWELARRTGDTQAQRKIGQAIEMGLYQLMTWQVGGPIPNDYLCAHAHEIVANRSTGGVMNGRANPLLRIDVTQHQIHAMLLARQFVYADFPKGNERIP